MLKHVLNCFTRSKPHCTTTRTTINSITIKLHNNGGIKYFNSSFINTSSSEVQNEITTNNDTKEEDNPEKLNVNNEKQERNMNKLLKKRGQMLESAKKFKDLNRKFSPPVEEPKKKKKASPDLKKAIKLLKFMDTMEKVSQGIDITDEEFAKYDNDDDPRIPDKKAPIARTRRTVDRHLDERNFNFQKPVPKEILKGEQKEIKRARKIIDDDEKHLKDKKPFQF